MDIHSFFSSPQNTSHKKYEALRAFCFEKKPAEEVAKQFGYTVSTLYSLARDFKRSLENATDNLFFVEPQLGRKPSQNHDEIHNLIVLLRKKYLSVQDIKSILDSQNKPISEKHIYNIIRTEGFARLPRRSKTTRNDPPTLPETLTVPKSQLLAGIQEKFNTQNAGVLCFLPLLKSYGIDKIIESSSYPGTKTVPTLQSILAFLALKLSNVRRYTADDLWCMDRGLGLFAGLNVLPKAAWYSSYSHRVTRDMNLSFLKQLHTLWSQKGLLSDTANLDFCTIPYWGDEDHLENNWSGTRHKALQSILAAVAHDPDSGIITYGDTNVRHDNESNVVIEFLDFYKKNGNQDLKYIVFDSKFTTYQNLRKLDDQSVKFITIRKRGKNLVKELQDLPASEWKTVTVKTSHGKTRKLKVRENSVVLKQYDKEIRQIAITGHGKIKPAILITNDFEMSLSDIIRKYAKRWLVEKTISEQTHFFHLNKVSSSMVIKVDFDLTMSILAFNLYQLLAKELPGFTNCTAQSLYEKFIHNGAIVEIKNNNISLSLKKKRHLPTLFEGLEHYLLQSIPWLHDRTLNISAATHS